MIELIATMPNTGYQSFFEADWIIFGLVGGVLWALKDKFNFGTNNREDNEQDYY